MTEGAETDSSSTGHFLNANKLFEIASQAYKAIPTELSDTAGCQKGALVALVFSACTLEALINELELWAQGCVERYSLPELKDSFLPRYIETIAEALPAMERSSTRAKFLIASRLLPGTPLDKGSQPFQDFALLFRLRDSIVHMKPSATSRTREARNVYRELVTRKLCAEPEQEVLSNWINHASTRAVACWACGVVRNMVEHLLASVAAEPVAYHGQSALITLWSHYYCSVM